MTDFVPQPPACFPAAPAGTKILIDALLTSGTDQTKDQNSIEIYGDEAKTPPPRSRFFAWLTKWHHVGQLSQTHRTGTRSTRILAREWPRGLKLPRAAEEQRNGLTASR
jgi:hypothetical protein